MPPPITDRYSIRMFLQQTHYAWLFVPKNCSVVGGVMTPPYNGMFKTERKTTI